MQIITSLSTLNDYERFWPWLYGIALNKVRRHKRSTRRDRAVSIVDGPEPQSKAKEVVLTDSIAIPKRIEKMKILSIAELMAQVIQRIYDHKSLGELFSWEENIDVGIRRE